MHRIAEGVKQGGYIQIDAGAVSVSSQVQKAVSSEREIPLIIERTGIM